MMTDVLPALRISGALAAGNFAQGMVTITPVANTPTSMAITGLNLAGTGTVHAWTTPNTAFPGPLPGGRVLETSVSDVSATGLTVWLYRTNTTATPVRWLAARNRA
jgi:hypothetical protein